jgi:DNA-binding CsgD family transcriptional regulator
MTELLPNIPLEITRAAISIAAWWVLFYKLHRPPTKIRRIIQLVSFVVCYVIWKIGVQFQSSTGNVILWAVMIIFFALVSGMPPGGDLRHSLFTALYYIGMEAAIDTIRYFLIISLFGKSFTLYSAAYNIQGNVQYLFVLGWAFFYYWIMKNRSARLPLRFWIMTVSPPLATTVLLTRYADVARPLLVQGTNLYIEGIFTGLFLFVFDLFWFYLYLKLTAAYDARGVVIKIANPLPLYSSETGLSPAFIRKFDITVREREVIEEIMRGKRSKEIAADFHIKVRTVENHLWNIYRKTGVSGRSGLFSLIRESEQLGIK